jgi:hypothetical protein
VHANPYKHSRPTVMKALEKIATASGNMPLIVQKTKNLGFDSEAVVPASANFNIDVFLILSKFR